MAFNRIIEVALGPKGEQGTLIKDLRIEFEVVKTEAESSNNAVLSIYNLTPSTMDKIGKVGHGVSIRAGYKDEGTVSLFFGTVKLARQVKDRMDRILEIEAYDGLEKSAARAISYSFSPGTKTNLILNEIVGGFPYPLASPYRTTSKEYLNGWSFVGNIKEALTQVLNYTGQKWTIQNEQLIIYEPEETVIRTGVLLTSETGMIEEPEQLLEDEDNDEEDVPKRWVVKSLLNGKIVPRSDIQIKSNKINGTYRIQTVKHYGDNWDGDFISEAEVVAR